MLTILVLIAIYLWTTMIFVDNPESYSLRRLIMAPLTIPLAMLALVLIVIVNAIAGTEFNIDS